MVRASLGTTTPITAPCVLVTGSGGYLGAPMVAALLAHGFRVIAFDAGYFGPQPLPAHVDPTVCWVVRGDVRSLPATLLDGVTAVIHLAALSNDPAAELDPTWTSSVNRDASIRLARLCAEQGVGRFLFASTCSVYGASDDQLLNEEAPLRPVTAYAQSKVEAEDGILALANETFQPVVLRLATLFGLAPRMRFDLALNAMTLRAVHDGRVDVAGDGRQWRPFLHVRDAARAFLSCLLTSDASAAGRPFNVVTANLQIVDLAATVAHRAGPAVLALERGEADPRTYRVSGRRFAAAVGFVPAVDLPSGIDEIASAIRSGAFDDPTDDRFHTVRVLRRFMASESAA